MRDVARDLYVEQRLTAAAIAKFLFREFSEPSTGYPPARTIQSWVAEFRIEAGEDWTLSPATAAEATVVLPVLQAVVEHSGRRVLGVGTETARWILAVHDAAPDLDAWRTYLVARRYQFASSAGESNLGLDLFLAYRPWRSEVDAERYAAALVSGRVPSASLWSRSVWPEVVRAVDARLEERIEVRPSENG